MSDDSGRGTLGIERRRLGDCAVIRFSAPPANAIDRALAERLLHELDIVHAEASVRCAVIAGAGRLFSAGADVDGLATDPGQVDAIRRLVAAVAASPKPVVAALHGVAFGGGLELALACHGRVAAQGTRLAFPEITLGLLPGAGGTQRLTRLCGARAALELMTTGTAIDAGRALELGLVDALVPEERRLDAAIRLAGDLAGADAPRPRARGPAEADAAAAIAAARTAATQRRDPSAEAARRIVDCVEAALAPDPAAGEAVEHRAFDTLLQSREFRALRHLFRGERIVAKLRPPYAGAAPLPVAATAIVGAGLMGTGIAIALLKSGLPVVLIDPAQAALERSAARIRDAFARDAGKGRLTEPEFRERMSRLSTSTGLPAAADADLVIEAVFEDLDVKRQVFRGLDAAVKPAAILASNTSTLDIDAIADAVGDPGRVVGMHFFSPAHVMRLVEVIRGPRTAPAVLATAMRLAKRIGKIGVVAGVCDGFIGNRMFEEYLRQAYFLLEEGALPAQVDAALERWGMAMGPFRVMDLAGQDIGWSIRKRRALEQPGRPYSRIPDLVCEAGRYGQKTGAGFYLYPDGRTPLRDPEIDDLVIAHSSALGIHRRTIDDDEIVSRCILALVNEGAHILEEGVAWRPVDIDVVWTAGYGFPRRLGGPMRHADDLGLAGVLDTILRYGTGYQGWAWQPSPLLRRLAERHLTFGGLDD